MRVLVVGGAGYIGSHMVKILLRSGHEVVILDDLSSGYREAVLGGDFVLGSLADRPFLQQLFKRYAFDAVMHFASYIEVAESVKNPAKYFQNNVVNVLNLLDTMIKHDVDRLIFSSTAAIFGAPEYIPIDEEHPKVPINPYGRSKWIVEQMLEDYDKSYGLKSVCLRYFNAAGADPDGELGERHDPETHLIPLILRVASGRAPHVSIFGTNYDTPDGTCIRDYIHVLDLCQAHLLALDYLTNGGRSDVFNLGNGRGFSVNEVINTAIQVTRKELVCKVEPRREGDPARLVADGTKAKQYLNWQPKYSDLETIILHAWRWEKVLRMGDEKQPRAQQQVS